jgi:RND superfamily putative drug exporter
VEFIDRRSFPLARLVSPHRSIVVVLLGLIVAGLAMAFAPDPTTGSSAGSNLPDSVESARAADLLEELPQADESPRSWSSPARAASVPRTCRP